MGSKPQWSSTQYENCAADLASWATRLSIPAPPCEFGKPAALPTQKVEELATLRALRYEHRRPVTLQTHDQILTTHAEPREQAILPNVTDDGEHPTKTTITLQLHASGSL